MANPGVGSKFLSVNLNRSYGQPSNSYGGNRPRSGSRGVGSGMVVLSRHQSSIMGVQKTGPKLSVPPPMNLPSLRKEHEGFDSSASVSGAVGSGNIGSGSRPTSSGMGWSKLAPSAFQEKDAGDDHHAKLVGDNQIVNGSNDLSSYSSSDVTSGRASGSVYMPPSARSGTLGSVVHSSRPSPVVDKAMVLKGEDFPSLQATLSSASGVIQKQHNVSQHRQKQRVMEEAFDQLKDSSYSGTSNHMRPQFQSSRPSRSSDESPVAGSGLSSSDTVEKSRKPDTYFPGPLPLAQLKHTSDWADDERDTGHGISDRERDQNTRERDRGYSRNESSWGNDFDFPRVGVMPRASVPNLSEGRGMLDGEGEKVPTTKFARGSTYNRDVRTSSGRGGGYNARDRYGIDQSDRYRGDFFPKSLVPKTSFSLGTRGPAVNDPVFNFIKEKRSSSVKQYLDDPFLKDIISGPGLDARDPITGGLVGVFKRKKDSSKQADFHDPVRESFEAELERVQKMQEQERQQILDEQTRAVELAQKEEEDRERFAREVIERRRRLEEEAREVKWRAEQERLDAIRRAEEQKTAREEERRRMHMEEERRKEAARKKLLELEARIARRQFEAKDDKFSTGAAVRDDKVYGLATDRDVSMATDVVDWEDGERMVERITNSASSDSSNPTRSIEMGSRPPYTRGGDSVFSDRAKPGNAWRRDVFEHGNSSSFMLHDQDNDNRGPRQDTFGAKQAVSRKDLYDSSGFVSGTGSSSKGGFSEPHQLDDFPHLRGHKWNFGGEMDHYGRNSDIDAEYYDNTTDKFGDIGWGQGRPRGSLHSPYPERLYQNFEGDGFFSYSRSRQSVRQPRVLPPPSLSSIHKNIRGDMENASSSASLDNETRYHHPSTENEASLANVQSETIVQEQKVEKAISSWCDSQSSLCVSSPPHSPIHLSDYDLEDSGDSPVLQTAAKGEEFLLSENEHDFSVAVDRNTNNSENVSPAEDEEWAIENDEELQEQEEYDEDDGYLKEDEIQEGDDEELASDFLSTPIVQLEEEEGPSGISNGDTIEPDNPSAILDDAKKQILETRRLFVRNLPYTASEEDLAEIFGKIGDISEVHLVVDRDTNRSKGVAYVLFKLPEFAVRAFEELNNSLFQGRLLHILPAKQRSVATDASLYLERAPGSILSPSSTSEADAQKYGVVGENNVNRATVEQEMEAISDPDRVESRSLFVKNLNFSTSDENLKKHFTEKIKEGRIHVQPMMPAVSSGVSQGEVPMNLQFGLFSGPSLIPSPVPAVQVGPIQMPVHIHPQVGSTVTHMHPSQPPFFQFGQLRYASPMSQGILPLASQSVSFVQPPVPTHYSFNQNQESAVNIPASQVSVIHQPESSVMFNDQPGVPKLSNISQDKPREVTVLASRQDQENEVLTSHSQAQNSILPNSESRSETLVQDQRQHDMAVKKNSRYAPNINESQGQVQAESTKSQFVPRDPGPISNSRRKRFVYTVKNSGSRPSFPVSEAPHSDFSGFHKRPRQKFRRTEFRVRENVEKRHTESVGSSENSGMDERLNFNGRMSGYSGRNGVVKKEFGYNEQSKHLVESAGLNFDSSGSRVADSDSNTEKQPGKEATAKRLTSSLNVLDSGEGNPKRNSSSVEDVDAPMQSGIVRIFRQTGIEAPSDEDDFIEVRSKRQMLIDRRKQREREIKAKSRIAKASRKPSYASQDPKAPVYSNKPSTLLVAEAASSVPSTSLVSDGTSNVEVVPAFKSAIASQPLAPIGTPAHNSDGNAVTRAHSIKPLKNISVPGISNNGTNLAPGSSLANKSVAMPAYLGSWGSARINQQTQLDDAMKTARFDSHVPFIGDLTTAAVDRSKPSSSILSQEKLYSSTASPLSSLLAGEKIQFGAVTSPTILPSSSRAISSDLGPPDSSRPDSSVDHTLSAVESDCSFFEKEQCPDKSCARLDDPEAEAEAEAAASAVAVAAIGSDEIVGVSPVSTSDTQGFEDDDIGSLASGGGSGNQQSTSQPRGEESLSVALPADLSVETPSLSLWPPLPSPQISSSQMLSHFPGAPPPHFPCYEMNPMLGAQIFSFAPHDESASTDSQSQKSSMSGSGPLGGWQPYPSGVDPFYGPPAGFTGPFIGPSGGIPGVQGPPHMVVYNHFTPVGQFGQVGLSFMGATYIPSGKQPDWKHHPIPLTTGTSEGDMNNLNIASAQSNPSSTPTPIPHLAPGSPLLPLGSPFAMFGVSQFQPPTDVPVQARWSHVPASHLHSVPLSVPLQQGEGGLPPQFSHGLCMDQSVVNRFHDACSVSPAQDTRRNFPVSNSATTAAQFPNELGLVDPAISTGSHVLNGSRTTAFSSSNTSFCSTNSNANVHNIVSKNSPRINAGNNGVDGGVHNSSNNQSMNSAHKIQSSTHHHQNSTHQQYLHPTSGYSNLDQREKVSSSSGSGGEWSHRRMGGFQGRNQSSRVDNKNYTALKTKQIYVAKTTTSGTSGMSTQD
ncbi:uncharacterized protein LOC113321808 isoform X2 [Papaver somniferum]|uniref:uncharacterized protein LOC113321808 isoform X2 n=1 Tax=Papaver somniferum TaxID=3469 RepID=UPI000E7001AE|nr:uncharacterized protein LOC113321808 isoform X2 [Papaver somniferum]